MSVGFDSCVAVFLVMYSCMKLHAWQVLLILRRLHGLSACHRQILLNGRFMYGARRESISISAL
jgi:hypothetical protein